MELDAWIRPDVRYDGFFSRNCRLLVLRLHPENRKVGIVRASYKTMEKLFMMIVNSRNEIWSWVSMRFPGVQINRHFRMALTCALTMD